MGIHVEYVEFKPTEECQIEISKLMHTDAGGGSYYGGEIGALNEAAFRGIKEDIEKVAKIVKGNIEKVNDIVYEIYVSGWGAEEINKILKAVEEVPGCKVALYFIEKYSYQTVGSQSGYSYITEKPFQPTWKMKEDEGPYHERIQPWRAYIGWDDLDYVVEHDGKLMRMTTHAKKGEIEVEFIEGGARITAIHPKKGVVNIPREVKGEPIIEVNSWPFEKKGIEIRAPYISINEWPDKNSRKAVALGYARGLSDGLSFDEEVIKKNDKYIKAQRKHLFDLAATDQSLLRLMFVQKMVTLEDIPVLIEKVNKAGNNELAAMVMGYREANFTAEDAQKLADKQLKKELEYDPLSPAELKKSWKTKANKDGTLEIVSYKGTEIDVYVPDAIGDDKVTSIGEEAFSVEQKGVGKDGKQIRESIVTVVIPDGIKSVGKKAFYGCTGLTNITWSKDAKKIEDEAFCGCKSLVSFETEANIEKIGDLAFFGCSSLVAFMMPKSIKSIGRSAFENCANLERIDVFAAIKEISDSMFKGCTRLKEVIIEEGIISICDSAFKGCEMLSDVKLPESIGSIGRSAFEGCALLVKIELPSGICDIKDATFADCAMLSEIIIPASVLTIGRKSFNKCKSLSLVQFLGEIKKISDMAFYGCSKLMSVNISNPDVQIGWDAFPENTKVEK